MVFLTIGNGCVENVKDEGATDHPDRTCCWLVGEDGMPANLPPVYFDAEKRFREAKTPESKIEALEEMLTIMPKHKGTDKLRADLRRRIAKLKEQAQQKKGGAQA